MLMSTAGILPLIFIIISLYVKTACNNFFFFLFFLFLLYRLYFFFKNVLFFFFLPYASFVTSHKYSYTSHHRSHQTRVTERTHTFGKKNKRLEILLSLSLLLCVSKESQKNFDSSIYTYTSEIILCPSVSLHLH